MTYTCMLCDVLFLPLGLHAGMVPQAPVSRQTTAPPPRYPALHSTTAVSPNRVELAVESCPLVIVGVPQSVRI